MRGTQVGVGSASGGRWQWECSRECPGDSWEWSDRWPGVLGVPGPGLVAERSETSAASASSSSSVRRNCAMVAGGRTGHSLTLYHHLLLVSKKTGIA